MRRSQLMRGISCRFEPTPSRDSGFTEETKLEHIGQGTKTRVAETTQGTLLGELESPLLDMGQRSPCGHTSQASGLLATQWFMFLHFIWWPRLQAVSPASG